MILLDSYKLRLLVIKYRAKMYLTFGDLLIFFNTSHEAKRFLKDIESEGYTNISQCGTQITITSNIYAGKFAI
jgi:hypothetical protein